MWLRANHWRFLAACGRTTGGRRAASSELEVSTTFMFTLDDSQLGVTFQIHLNNRQQQRVTCPSHYYARPHYRGVATGGYRDISPPKKKISPSKLLWCKNDIGTAIQHSTVLYPSSKKNFIPPPKKKTNFWLRPCRIIASLAFRGLQILTGWAKNKPQYTLHNFVISVGLATLLKRSKRLRW